MSDSGERHDVTRLLQDWAGGQREALDKLIPAVHDELRKLAGGRMRHERPDHTLQVTGLVNEAYMRLIDQKRVQWRDRRHFFAIASECMRRILVDYARQRGTKKRGGDKVMVELDEFVDAAEERGINLIALDDALAALNELDPRQAKIVELRYFGGLTVAEIAETLDVSPATIKREWDTARIWLAAQLKKDGSR
jgi:RNA polymerase sigma factor (TIGR02999 family)